MKDTQQLRISREFQECTPKRCIFKNLFLGKLHDTMPFKELAACLPPENQGEKGLGQLQEVISELKGAVQDDEEFAYLLTVKTLLSQETFLLGHPAKELKNRIVSLPQPYVRPIKR